MPYTIYHILYTIYYLLFTLQNILTLMILKLRALFRRPVKKRRRTALAPFKEEIFSQRVHILPVEGFCFQKLYLAWRLEPESLNGQYMDPLGVGIQGIWDLSIFLQMGRTGQWSGAGLIESGAGLIGFHKLPRSRYVILNDLGVKDHPIMDFGT